MLKFIKFATNLNKYKFRKFLNKKTKKREANE